VCVCVCVCVFEVFNIAIVERVFFILIDSVCLTWKILHLHFKKKKTICKKESDFFVGIKRKVVS
jgi:hypothetical protein